LILHRGWEASSSNASVEDSSCGGCCGGRCRGSKEVVEAIVEAKEEE